MRELPKILHLFMIISFGLMAILLSVSAPATAQPQSANERSEVQRLGSYILEAATKQSGQVQVKVFVTNRRRHGNLMDAKFRMEFFPLPQAKTYVQCFWDMGMKLSGAKPACMAPGSVWPNEDGKIVVYFEATDLAKGEWVQITIRSTDGQIRKSGRFAPFK